MHVACVTEPHKRHLASFSIYRPVSMAAFLCLMNEGHMSVLTVLIVPTCIGHFHQSSYFQFTSSFSAKVRDEVDAPVFVYACFLPCFSSSHYFPRSDSSPTTLPAPCGSRFSPLPAQHPLHGLYRGLELCVDLIFLRYS